MLRRRGGEAADLPSQHGCSLSCPSSTSSKDWLPIHPDSNSIFLTTTIRRGSLLVSFASASVLSVAKENSILPSRIFPGLLQFDEPGTEFALIGAKSKPDLDRYRDRGSKPILANWVWVLCNDCNKVSEVDFHVIGHKCGHCNSYNTRSTSRPADLSGSSSPSTTDSS